MTGNLGYYTLQPEFEVALSQMLRAHDALRYARDCCESIPPLAASDKAISAIDDAQKLVIVALKAVANGATEHPGESHKDYVIPDDSQQQTEVPADE